MQNRMAKSKAQAGAGFLGQDIFKAWHPWHQDNCFIFLWKKKKMKRHDILAMEGEEKLISSFSAGRDNWANSSCSTGQSHRKKEQGLLIC